MSNEHPLLTSARAATSDPSAHAFVQEVITKLEAVLHEALTCADPARARTLLPAALNQLDTETGVLISRSLLSGTSWGDAWHRRLVQRAQELFGPAQRVVPAVYHESYTPQRGVFR